LKSFKVIDLLGTTTAGGQASQNHDEAYRVGIDKVGADGKFFADMVKGAVSNLAFQRNGFIKAAVG
jgi:hypothetical protein